MWKNLSNGLSLLRAPLALLFLQTNVSLRVLAVLLAMLTDSLDGYVARKNKVISRFGTILDPTMDKFFVYFSLGILFWEGALQKSQVFMMVSRDVSLCIFACYLFFTRKWASYEFRSIRFGKITTSLQFLVLLGMSFHKVIPSQIFWLFVLFGVLSLLELFYPFFLKEFSFKRKP